MPEPSRELLDPPSRPSILETLILNNKGKEAKTKGDSRQRPTIASVPTSQILGKVRDFLGEMSKANEQLEIAAREKPREEIDLEALTGNEKEYIEMDLVLGVADLNSDEAVAAAESAVCGIQPTARPFACDSSEEEDDESDDECENSTVKSAEHVEKTEENTHKKKREKIVELN